LNEVVNIVDIDGLILMSDMKDLWYQTNSHSDSKLMNTKYF
jgi:hypothetical protein